MTKVRFFNERGRDRYEEYLDIKRRHPTEAKAISDAIALIVADPEKAARSYSILLGDREARYFAMPFQGPSGLTCLVWRPFPDGDDGVEIVHFQQAWGDDLDMPRVWPRD